MARWWSARRGSGPSGADLAVALLLVAVGIAELRRTGSGGSAPWLAYAVTMAVCAATGWRRLAPLPVALVAYAGTFGLLLAGLDDDNLGIFVAYLLAAYSLGAHARVAETLRSALALLTAVGAGALLLIPLPDAAGFLLLSAGAFAVGRLARHKAATVRALRSETQRLLDEREARAQAAVEEERRRIARELHDVVAHSVSLMTLQTGAGRKAMRQDPERADAMLRAAELTGRQATAEMHRLLDMMRADDADLTAQPGLAQLDRLVESARSAGKPVAVVVDGQPNPLPPGVDLAAYRVVQEALTNSLKHAGTTPARIRLRHLPDAISIEVVDEGPVGGLRWPPQETGHGLAGMRERARLYGGELVVEPHDGGLRVAATLSTAVRT